MSELLRKASLGVLSAAFAVKSALAGKKEVDPMQSEKTKGRVHAFEMKLTDGKPKKLADYKGRPLLIVNTASLCGFTPQYKDLQDLYERFKARGLAIAAFPANEFGAQEPGTDADIKSFCMTKYAIGFDLFAKITVKGAGIHPLYAYLTAESGFPGEIEWNFSKFLVDGEGKVVGRFGPEDSPTGAKIVKAVEALLPK